MTAWPWKLVKILHNVIHGSIEAFLNRFDNFCHTSMPILLHRITDHLHCFLFQDDTFIYIIQH